MILFCAALIAQERPAADLILTNAKVWTVDKAHPTAEAVAVIGDRIVGVGSATEIDQWRGVKTRVLDMRGKLMLPGFNDAHVHFVSGGQQLASIDLRQTHSSEEFAQTIAAYIKTRNIKPGEWITGGDWDEQLWEEPTLPTRQMIDKVTPENPVALNRHDGHEILANTAALKLAGLTAQTKDPAGGAIVRDKSGEPTGILKDAAQSLVFAKVPPTTHEQRVAAAVRALDYAASLGVTSVQDMAVDYADMAVYQELADRGRLTARIYLAPLETGWQDQAKLGIRHAF
ncbi:MAG TPA: amidohydrolase family protein, partial [Terriglobales bacterium]